MDETAARLAGLGIENRLGLADTPGAAWALARFGATDDGAPDGGATEARIAAPGETHTAIAGLPVEGLRLACRGPLHTCCVRLGLVTIGAVDVLPRASLARRFPSRERSSAVLARLDQALGRFAEPIVPLVPPPACLERLALHGAADRPRRGSMRRWPGSCRGSPRPWSGTGSACAGSRVWCYRVGRQAWHGIAGRHGAHEQGRRSPHAPLPGDAGDHRSRLRHRSRWTLHAERVEPLGARCSFRSPGTSESRAA